MAMNTLHMGLHHAPHVAHLRDEMDVDPGVPDERGDVETEYDDDVDEEVDQLDSDTEEEGAPPAQSASPPKARQRRTVQRGPGHSSIPLERVRTVLDADGMSETTSKEAMFMLAAAAEAFTKRLAEAGHRQAAAERRNTITYRDFATAASEHHSFKFLRDTIPQPLSLGEALQRRAAKEKELLEPTPTAAPSAAPSVAPSPLPSFTPLPTPMASAAPSNPSTSHAPLAAAPPSGTRGKTRTANGTGKGETAARRQSTREPKPRRRGEASNEPQSVSARASAKEDLSNGKPNGARRTSRVSRSRGTTGDSTSAHSRHVNGSAHYSLGTPPTSARSLGHGISSEYPMMNGTEEHWMPTVPGQLIGGPGVPFGRNGLGMADNPGRTIYSQQRQPNR